VEEATTGWSLPCFLKGGLREASVVALNQIRSVDRQRLVKRLGSLKPSTMASVDQALRVSMGLVKL
jgi:mRNA interferase MazF